RPTGRPPLDMSGCVATPFSPGRASPPTARYGARVPLAAFRFTWLVLAATSPAGEISILERNHIGCATTHLAQALAHEAARQGFDILFASAHRMLSQLKAGRADGRLEKRLASLLTPQLLVLDNLGMAAYTATQAEDLYELVDAACEGASIVLTSNRG